MTAAEKAKELVDRYMPTTYFGVHKEQAKACAIICVDELIDLSDRVSDIANNYFKDLNGNYKDAECELKFWYKVKQEINKL